MKDDKDQTTAVRRENDGGWAFSKAECNKLGVISCDFRLSEDELADLFHVSVHAMRTWRAYGPPADRVWEINRIYDFARYFAACFDSRRGSAIARASLKGLGTRTILEVLGAEGVPVVFAYLGCVLGQMAR